LASARSALPISLGTVTLRRSTPTPSACDIQEYYATRRLLQDVIDRGTARAARGAISHTAVAGKTGTSRDGWFVGYTPNLVCAVWIGFDDNRQLGLTGAEAALPAWVEFMRAAVDLRPELGGRSFDRPEGITIAEVDPETDELATTKCPMRERVAMLSAQVPLSECFRHNFYFEAAGDQAAQTVAATSGDSAQKHKRQNSVPLESALFRNSQVDTDQRGRSVLVNDLRPTLRLQNPER